MAEEQNVNEEVKTELLDNKHVERTELISKELLTDEQILQKGVSKENTEMYRIQVSIYNLHQIHSPLTFYQLSFLYMNMCSIIG